MAGRPEGSRTIHYVEVIPILEKWKEQVILNIRKAVHIMDYYVYYKFELNVKDTHQAIGKANSTYMYVHTIVHNSTSVTLLTDQ